MRWGLGAIAAVLVLVAALGGALSTSGTSLISLEDVRTWLRYQLPGAAVIVDLLPFWALYLVFALLVLAFAASLWGGVIFLLRVCGWKDGLTRRFDELQRKLGVADKEAEDARFEEVFQDFQAAHRRENWAIPEAFLCCILATAAADGQLTIEEASAVQALARRSRVLKKLDQEQLKSANEIVKQRMRDRPQALREACESIPRDMRMSLFAHCVDIALADGIWHPTEAELLTRIVAFMGLDSSKSKRVMEALFIKNLY